jgi:hypothetical protein
MTSKLDLACLSSLSSLASTASPTRRRPGLRRIALCLAGAIAISGVAMPRLAAAASKEGGEISRAEVVRRAKYWYDHRGSIPYTTTGATHRDPDNASHDYRRDCSGFVSMALHLKSSLSTVTLPGVGTKISRGAMHPGDFTGILGAGTDGSAGHVRLFEKWANQHAGTYWAYDFGSTPVKHQIYKLSTDAPRHGIGWTAYRYKKVD